MQPAGIEPTLQESESCVLSVRLRLRICVVCLTKSIITQELEKGKLFFTKKYKQFINFSENA